MEFMDNDNLGILFKQCDRNRSGYIEREDLEETIGGPSLSVDQVNELFDCLGIEDGRISQEAFVKGFQMFQTIEYSLDEHEEARRPHSPPPAGPASESEGRGATPDCDMPHDRHMIVNPLGAWASFKHEIGAEGARLIPSQDQVCEMYKELHAAGVPQLLQMFETIVFDVVKDIKQHKSDIKSLESSLRRANDSSLERLRNLEEDMESQMSRLEQRIRKEENEKAEMEKIELKQKLELQIGELTANTKRLQMFEEKMLQEKPNVDSLSMVKQQSEELTQENRVIKSALAEAETKLALVRSDMSQVQVEYREQSKELKQERENMKHYIKELEKLTSHLHVLHDANKKLNDTNDDLMATLEAKKMSEITPIPRPEFISLPSASSTLADEYVEEATGTNARPSSKHRKRRLRQRYNSLGSQNEEVESLAECDPQLSPTKDFREYGDDVDSGNSTMRDPAEDSEYESTMDEEYVDATNRTKELMDAGVGTCPRHLLEYSNKSSFLRKVILPQDWNQNQTTAESDRKQDRPQTGRAPEVVEKVREKLASDIQEQPMTSKAATPTPTSPVRAAGAGAGTDINRDSSTSSRKSVSSPTPSSGASTPRVTSQRKRTLPQVLELLDDLFGSETEEVPPTASKNGAVASKSLQNERMYRIVMAGDAAVGKTSFVLRLCKQFFRSNVNSTLGVDFQMKTMEVDGKVTSLQLWDTAGQERFRSIAKSYFRRADGVILLYDCTYERSFLNVREWMETIQDSARPDIPMILCGNKVDAREAAILSGTKVINTIDGEKLAKEYGALFLETSAKDNSNITETVEALARKLHNIQDEVKSTSEVDLEHPAKKESSCCDL